MISKNQQFDVTLTGEVLDIENRFIPIIDEMNNSPITICKTSYDRIMSESNDLVSSLKANLREKTGIPGFRPNASADCTAYFISLGWKPTRLTPTGKAKMDEKTIDSISSRFPHCSLIIEARKAISINAQLKKWSEFANLGTTQPIWDSFGTPMGRLSCASVALQNRVMSVRETVVPSEGCQFVSVDVKQMEYLGWASLSGDPSLNQIIDNGADLHQEMGDRLRKYLPETYSASDRRKAGKTINFALLYWMSAPTLASQLKISTYQAEVLMEKYAEMSPTALEYRDRIVKEVRESGVVSTYFGRRRKIKNISSSYKSLRRDAEKTAWHHHNSGSCADLFKLRMVSLLEALVAASIKPYARFLINMHDEVILEVRDDYVECVEEIIREVMEAPVEGFRDMKFTIVHGWTWAELDS